MKYKGFQIERTDSSMYGKFYFIVLNGEQIYPNDDVCPVTIKQCKDLINHLIKK